MGGCKTNAHRSTAERLNMATVGVNNSLRAEIQILSNTQFSSLIMPWGRVAGPAPDANNGTLDLAGAIIANVYPDLQDCMSSDAEISGIRVTGLGPGFIPYATAHAAGTFPGTRAAVTAPNQVAALAYFLPDANDLGGARVVEAKDFIPGIATGDIVRDILVAGLQAAIAAFAAAVIGGFVDAAGVTWGRIVGKVPGVPTDRLIGDSGGVRGPVKTQRRRLSPVPL